MLEFADVAGPIVLAEPVHGGRGNLADVLMADKAVFLEKMVGQQGDIVFSLAEGRHENRHDVEPIKEFAAELSLGSGQLKLCIGCGNDPDIHFDDLVAADLYYFAFL